MHRKNLFKKTAIRFKRWSRRGCAPFSTLGKEISIGQLNVCADSGLLTEPKERGEGISLLAMLTAKAKEGESPTYDEALALCQVADKEALYSAANSIRQHHFGEQFDLCSIINARSGRCTEDCKWCAQSKYYTTHSEIYPLLSYPTLLLQASKNEQAGVRKFSLVTSGRNLSMKDLKTVSEQYSLLSCDTQLELCASLGLLTEEELSKLYASGVRNYHCNLETAPSYFSTLCTTHTSEEKINTLKAARKVGMKLCSGGIIGMGESMEQRIEMAFTLKELGVHSIPLNLLNPIPGTPLEHTPRLTNEEILTTIALFRFINPKAWLRFAGGRILLLDIQDSAMKAGINGAIVGDLLTTVGVDMEQDIAHIKSLGFVC